MNLIPRSKKGVHLDTAWFILDKVWLSNRRCPRMKLDRNVHIAIDMIKVVIPNNLVHQQWCCTEFFPFVLKDHTVINSIVAQESNSGTKPLDCRSDDKWHDWHFDGSRPRFFRNRGLRTLDFRAKQLYQTER